MKYIIETSMGVHSGRENKLQARSPFILSNLSHWNSAIRSK